MSSFGLISCIPAVLEGFFIMFQSPGSYWAIKEVVMYRESRDVTHHVTCYMLPLPAPASHWHCWHGDLWLMWNCTWSKNCRGYQNYHSHRIRAFKKSRSEPNTVHLLATKYQQTKEMISSIAVLALSVRKEKTGSRHGICINPIFG